MAEEKKDTLSNLTEEQRKVLHALEDEGYVEGEDYFALIVKCRGKSTLIVIKAPNKAQWRMLMDAKNDDSAAADAKITEVLKQATVSPSADELVMLFDAKPAVIDVVVAKFTSLAFTGVEQALK